MSFKTLSRKYKEMGPQPPEVFPSLAQLGEIARMPYNPQTKIPQLEELAETLSANNVYAPIAGGSVLASLASVPYGDIDIFTCQDKSSPTVSKILNNLGYKEESKEEHFTQFRHRESIYRPVQVINIWEGKGTIDSVILSFDLSICQVALSNNELIASAIGLRDIEKRILRCTGTLALSSLFHRVEKYKGRGFSVLDEAEVGFPITQAPAA